MLQITHVYIFTYIHIHMHTLTFACRQVQYIALSCYLYRMHDVGGINRRNWLITIPNAALRYLPVIYCIYV